MQNSDRGEKNRVYFDGDEVTGLVSVGERLRESGLIDVPSFSKIRPVQNGVTKYVPIELKYKLVAGSNTAKFFDDWYDNKEVKQVVISRTDAHGTEFARTLYLDCECVSITEPAYTAETPIYAQITIKFTFDDRKKLL